jgi:hypothetical protein
VAKPAGFQNPPGFFSLKPAGFQNPPGFYSPKPGGFCKIQPELPDSTWKCEIPAGKQRWILQLGSVP